MPMLAKKGKLILTRNFQRRLPPSAR